MKILCVDTSTSTTLIALSEDAQILDHESVSSADHAAALLPTIEAVLLRANLRLKDIDGFGVVTGPGSFTGLRIGLSTIKGFCLAYPRPVVGLHSLQLLALSAPLTDQTLAPVIHSRKGKVFTALYQRTEEHLREILKPTEVDVPDFFKDNPGVIIFGSAIEKQPLLFSSLPVLASEYFYPKASRLCMEAHKKFVHQETLSIESAEPDYLVSSVASLV